MMKARAARGGHRISATPFDDRSPGPTRNLAALADGIVVSTESMAQALRRHRARGPSSPIRSRAPRGRRIRAAASGLGAWFGHARTSRGREKAASCTRARAPHAGAPTLEPGRRAGRRTLVAGLVQGQEALASRRGAALVARAGGRRSPIATRSGSRRWKGRMPPRAPTARPSRRWAGRPDRRAVLAYARCSPTRDSGRA